MKAIAVFLAVLACVSVGATTYRPVVLMHGVIASAKTMDPVVSWIQEAYPGIYVKNVEIGDGVYDSVFMPMDHQIDSFKQTVQEDRNLTNGFDLIGYSQGGLIARAFVERYNSPQVYNLITWSAPHEGSFGLPLTNDSFFQEICRMVGEFAYLPFVQNSISFAEYWKDPYQLSTYYKVNRFLTDINNELEPKNQTYKAQLLTLTNFVLIDSSLDEVVKPWESAWFWFYKNGTDKDVVPLEQEPWYQEDWIGLQTLNSDGRLHFATIACPHQDEPTEQCKKWFTMYTQQWLGTVVETSEFETNVL